MTPQQTIKIEQRDRTRMPKRSDIPNKKNKLSIENSSRNGLPFSYTRVEEMALRDLIDQCTSLNGAVMFGRTRDGGAGTMRFYHDDVQTKTQYFADEIEFDEEMRKLDALLRRLRES